MGFATMPAGAYRETQEGQVNHDADAVVEEAFAGDFRFEGFGCFGAFEDS